MRWASGSVCRCCSWGVGGSLLARLLSLSLGRIVPQLISLGASCIAVLLLVFGSTPFAFATSSGLIALSWFYGLPYQMGLLAAARSQGARRPGRHDDVTAGMAAGPGIAAFAVGGTATGDRCLRRRMLPLRPRDCRAVGSRRRSHGESARRLSASRRSGRQTARCQTLISGQWIRRSAAAPVTPRGAWQTHHSGAGQSAVRLHGDPFHRPAIQPLSASAW